MKERINQALLKASELSGKNKKSFSLILNVTFKTEEIKKRKTDNILIVFVLFLYEEDNNGIPRKFKQVAVRMIKLSSGRIKERP